MSKAKFRKVDGINTDPYNYNNSTHVHTNIRGKNNIKTHTQRYTYSVDTGWTEILVLYKNDGKDSWLHTHTHSQDTVLSTEYMHTQHTLGARPYVHTYKE